MRRLRDQRDSDDPIVARAARLLSARQPLADDGARQQRVRARLRRRRAAPRAVALLRLALLVVVTCSVAAASAMIGKVATAYRALREERRAEVTHNATRRRVATHVRVAQPAPVTPPTIPVPPSTIPAPPIAPAPIAPPAIATATPARETGEALLVDAVRALRHQHDPARATELLAQYLDRHPDGVAAEDALALALEATIGRDPPRAAGFATRYLARYPSGRWTALARRALEP